MYVWYWFGTLGAFPCFACWPHILRPLNFEKMKMSGRVIFLLQFQASKRDSNPANPNLTPILTLWGKSNLYLTLRLAVTRNPSKMRNFGPQGSHKLSSLKSLRIKTPPTDTGQNSIEPPNQSTNKGDMVEKDKRDFVSEWKSEGVTSI